MPLVKMPWVLAEQVKEVIIPVHKRKRGGKLKPIKILAHTIKVPLGKITETSLLVKTI